MTGRKGPFVHRHTRPAVVVSPGLPSRDEAGTGHLRRRHPGPLVWGAEVGSTTTRLLPGDNPQAYLPGDRRRALARGEVLPRVSPGAARVRRHLRLHPAHRGARRGARRPRGAEELTATLDRVFAALLERLHVWRGSVIYFSGDAVTAWIDGDDGSRATACALEMQEVMDEVGRWSRRAAQRSAWGSRSRSPSDSAHRFVVGDPDVQLIDVLAGGSWTLSRRRSSSPWRGRW